MTDLASLDIKVDSTSADAASASLDRLTAAGQRTESATKRLAAAQADASDKITDAKAQYKAGQLSLEAYNEAVLKTEQELRNFTREYNSSLKSMDKMTDQAKRTTGGLNGIGGSAQLASHHLLNLGYQINDVIVGLTSGQKPMTVFIQQGTQIGQISAQSGVSLGGMAKAVGNVILNFAKAHPLIIGFTAAAGLAAAGIKVFTDELTKSAHIKEYTESLGLTKKQLKNLQDAHVTFGDVFKGVWKTIDDAVGASKMWEKFSKTAREYLGDVLKAVVGASVGIYTAFEAAYTTIKQTWSKLPSAIGDATIQAANLAIRAVQNLVNAGITGLNDLASGVNKLVGKDLLGNIQKIDLGQLNNQFAGSAKEVADTFKTNFATQFKKNIKSIEDLGTTLAKNITDATKKRLKDEAEDMLSEHKARVKKIKDLNKEIADDLADTLGKQAASVDKFMDKLDRELVIKVNLGDAERAVSMVVDGLRAADEYAAQLSFEDATKDVDRMRMAAQGLSDAWGKVGGAIGKALDVLADYTEGQADLDKQLKTGSIDQAKYAKQSADLQLNSLVGLAGATEGLFKKHSAGAKAAEAAEKALAVVQLARTAVAVAEGAAQMFATAGPAGFGLVAAMLAVMASLGFSGHGGGGGAPTSNQGTGTVLGGGSDAKSESIQHSLDLLNSVSGEDLRYAMQMAASLKAIENNIGNLGSLLVRTGNIDGATAGIKTGFNSSISGSLIGAAAGGPIGALLNNVVTKIPVIGGLVSGLEGIVKSLFGTKTSIVGSGLFGSSQDLGGILSNGFDLQTYADIQKKKKFLGITTGTSYSTQYGQADDQVAQQFALILKQFDQSILAAAGPLGVATDTIKDKLDNFVVSIGKIDFTGLSGDEIQSKLEAVFGAVADQMAAGAFPGIEKYQKVGEGAFETLVRVATEVETVTESMKKLGLSAHSLGIDVSEAIINLFGSASDYAKASDAYFEDFYSQAEQNAAQTQQLTDALAGFGLALPSSIEAYRKLVESQDLTTDAGRQAYAVLIQLGPAFADLQKAMGATIDTAEQAASVLRERQDIEQKILELQGNTAELRARELAGLDPSNRALMQQYYDLVDAQNAASAAAQAAAEAAAAQAAADQALAEERQKLVDDARSTLTDAYQREADALTTTIDKFQSFSDSLKEFRASLNDQQGVDSFTTLLNKFNDIAGRAATGDADALSKLQGVSSDYLDAVKGRASSLVDYQRAVAQVANAVDKAIDASDEATDYAQAQLDALKASVSQLIDINDNVITVAQAIAQLTAALRGAGQPVPTGNALTNANAVPSVPATVPTSSSSASSAAQPQTGYVVPVQDKALSDMLQALLVAIKLDTGKVSRVLERADNGDSLRISVGDGDTIPVEIMP